MHPFTPPLGILLLITPSPCLPTHYGPLAPAADAWQNRTEFETSAARAFSDLGPGSKLPMP